MIDDGSHNETISYIENATADSQIGRFHYVKAMSYISAGEFRSAIDELTKCIEFEPENIEAAILKAKVLWSLNMENAGNEIFWKAHSLNPLHPEVGEFLRIMKPKAQ